MLATVLVALPHCPLSSSLYMAELRLEGNFLHRLPSEVSTLHHLKAIDLSRNQFRDFPEQLTTLPALETISLEENEIVGECPPSTGLGDAQSLCLLTWAIWAWGKST